MQTDQLPVYPPNIQGELRLILQNKDLFLLAYKYLEDYRRLSDEQNRIITKEFIEEQLKLGEEEIDELKVDEAHAEGKLTMRMRHNDTLLGQLSLRGMNTVGEGLPRKNMCRSPSLRKCRGLANQTIEKTRDLSLFDNIALAIEEIQRELKDKLKPVCDFHRDLFYLQLHFTLVLTQVCNYCMPLVTENIGLIDRIFFWADRPEFDLVRKSSEIADRLKDIYTRTQSVLTLLVENVMFIQNKVELQKNLEKKFQERLEVQQIQKDQILRKIHISRQDLDQIDEENDRLVGVLVKLDPKYVSTDHFNELAEFSIRRNYLEGRLTPEGFKVRNNAFSSSPTNIHNLKPLFSNTNSSSTKNIMKENENFSNNEKCFKEGTKVRRKKSHTRKYINKKDQKNVGKVNVEDGKDHKNSVQQRSSLDSTELDTAKAPSPKFSIKDKLLSKTKEIFETAFKKPARHKQDKSYVKVFEGEILAELSQFSPLCGTPNNVCDSWDNSNDKNSMERSLKRKYDFHESQLHNKESSLTKKPSRLKSERNKKDVPFSSNS